MQYCDNTQAMKMRISKSKVQENKKASLLIWVIVIDSSKKKKNKRWLGFFDSMRQFFSLPSLMIVKHHKQKAKARIIIEKEQ